MKNIKFLVLFITAILLISLGLVLAAKPDFQAAKVTNPVTGEPKNTVTLPATAIQVAPNIFYLGTAMDRGRVVEGYAFITPKREFAKPGTQCGNGICEPSENAKNCPQDCGSGNGGTDTSSCYSFLAKGAKWKTVEPYLVNRANIRNLDATFVTGNIAFNIGKWEGAVGKNILGDEVAGVVDGADTISPDNKNEVYFADIRQSGAIAITIVWGIFSGPPWARELVEWDQVYDQVDFDWSSSGEAGKMDFENIATHELGHSVGLDDLYDDKCLEQTMYGYASYGETKKRTLESGDITGVRELYK